MTLYNGLLVAALLCGPSCLAQHGVLDLSFGNGGYAFLTSPGSGPEDLDCIKADPQGRVLVGGRDDGSIFEMPFMVRLTENGILDSTFGTVGHVQLNLCLSNDFISEIDLAPNGSIYFLGQEDFPLLSPDVDQVVIGRLTDNGVLDPTYGVGGLLASNLNGEDSYGRALLAMPDGGVLVAVESSTLSVLIRRSDSGALDPTFGAGGTMVQEFGPGNHYVQSLAHAQNGKVFAGGEGGFNGNGLSFVARMSAQGVLDPLFSSDGVASATYQFVNWTGYNHRTFEMPDAGVLTTPHRRKYDLGGTYTPLYNTTLAWTCEDAGPIRKDAAMAADGSMYLLGFDVVCDTLITALEPDGTLDQAFGDAGYLLKDGSGTWLIEYCTVDPQGRLLVAGNVSGGIRVARYLLDTAATAPTAIVPSLNVPNDRIVWPNPWSPVAGDLQCSVTTALQRAWLLAADGRFVTTLPLRSVADQQYSLTPVTSPSAGSYVVMSEDVHGIVRARPLLVVE